jgi:hypothetical protein
MRSWIILIAIVITLKSHVYTQSYQSIFGSDTTQWNYLTDYKRADWISTDKYISYGDTVIDEFSFQELHETLAFMNPSQLGFIREDTVVGKVWLRSLDDTIDYLVMDLSLELNDTFILKSKHTEAWDVICTVKEIQQLDSRKTLVLEGFGLNDNLTFIEGIGTNYTFQVFDFLGFSQLLCVFKDSELVYKNPEFDSCFVDIGLSTPEKKSRDLKVTYNSRLNTISIYSNNMLTPAAYLRLIDLYGRTIFSTEVLYSHTDIELPSINPGIYIISINGLSQRLIINGN